jgi:hypothetical protein
MSKNKKPADFSAGFYYLGRLFSKTGPRLRRGSRISHAALMKDEI